MEYTKKLILETGEEYFGFSFGAEKDSVCELVFNTSMAGYQEILSDPSYTYQAVVMTYPLIGNYGMCEDRNEGQTPESGIVCSDYECRTPSIGAFIVREYNDEPSNFRSVNTFSEIMKKFDIPGIYGIDTRKLTRCIRDKGSMKVLICSASVSHEEGMEILKNTGIPTDAVSKVSRKQVQSIQCEASAEKPLHVVCIDCGMKENIVRSFIKRGVSLDIVPWNTDAETILSLSPSGLFISNGPGDPTDVPETIATVKALIGRLPIFGICLGHQIISLAYGAKTYKLKFGHRGGNHPVRNQRSGKIEITSQNHSYAVDSKSLEGTSLEATHINLLDNTIEGVSCEKDGVFSVQHHPESAPGPMDSAYLFEQFIDIMNKRGK